MFEGRVRYVWRGGESEKVGEDRGVEVGLVMVIHLLSSLCVYLLSGLAGFEGGCPFCIFGRER